MNVDKGEDLFRMALSAETLPFQLGLDWSHDSWRIAATRKAGFPNWDNNQVLLNVVRGTGSIVSYDAVPASQLRVCPKGRSDPSIWPMLSDVTADQVESA